MDAGFSLHQEQGATRLRLAGDWKLSLRLPATSDLMAELAAGEVSRLRCDCAELGEWDSGLAAFVFHARQWCQQAGVEFDVGDLPEGAARLLKTASAVAPHRRAAPQDRHPGLTRRLERAWRELTGTLDFIGQVALALGRLLRGQAKSRPVDYLGFMFDAGPGALGIITVTSFLVGMILAYLGAAQLRQLGAELYVVDLVAVGILREMGALMTAIVMAGRTGAAYAAQLGTMQTNEEIDAITTLGISPVEFLVLPRMAGLLLIMPILVLYSNLVGIAGGALVAAGMDVNPTQFGQQLMNVFSFTHLGVGLGKGLLFALLIAFAGCRAGMHCGRSSAAVGQATTNAVVTSVVYLIVADATVNILLQELGI